MQYPVNRFRFSLVAGTAVLAVTTLVGCTGALFTAAYLIKGNDTPAECDKLCGKRVVVVCRPVVALQYRDARADQDLAEQVSLLLKTNVKKIKIIDHRKVAEWMDEHSWQEYVEVGKALGADIVVGIDLEHFELRPSQTLFQGKANSTVVAIDCHTKTEIFHKQLPQVVYPPNRVVQASDVQEQTFRREFIRVAADQISRHFHSFDPHADFAMDSKSIE